MLASVLRAWDLKNIPYTHDETSALVRIYPTLSGTITKGVIELDTHPPGVQVFEWAWTKLFGMNEAAVKLPFMLLATIALFFLYRFALAWTSAPNALVLTALLATLQYTVMYAQIARPYAIGFFTTALLADQITRYLAFGKRSALITTGVAIVLSAYTHHFALLLAGIMTLTGLVLVLPQQRKAYLVMCGAAAIAYLPNVPIFLKQLSLGGLAEWLSPPDAYWLQDHVQWLVHYSPLFAAGLLVLVLLWFLPARGPSRMAGPSRWFLLLWGLAPLVIGLAYSIWRAPVIQYSMLLFSFPYWVIALFAGTGILDRTRTWIAVGFIAVVGTSTLIQERRHYDLFYSSKYDVAIEKAAEEIAQYGHDQVLVMLDMPEPQVRFALSQHGIDPAELRCIHVRDLGSGELASILAASAAERVVLGISNGGNVENPARVQSHFPFIQERIDLVEGQVFVMAVHPTERTVVDRKLIASASPVLTEGSSWDVQFDLPIVQTENRPLWDLRGRDFGIAYRFQLDTCLVEADDLFEVEVDLETTSTTIDAAIVLELHFGDSLVLYRTDELTGHAPGSVRSIVAGSRRNVHRGAGPIEAKTYVYNRKKSDLLVRRHEGIQA
ncbi:MAG: glycosyltransferase family 39 protein [Flavobacteriales bacterium]